ncbi:MAG TPA: DUF2865 domain-containing protein [Bauldia sp.]|nr:DUF2865 domain-containing protein [Bauldia sp.]
MRLFNIHAVSVATIVALLVPIVAEAATCSSLRAELASLDRKSGKNSGNADRQVRQLEIKAQKNGCFRGAFVRKKPSCGRILSQLQRLKQKQLRGSNRSVDQRREWIQNAIARSCGRRDSPQRQANQSGGYRTLCVRSCDGYYFPINFSAGRDRLKIDDAYCKQLYGDGRAELYVHSSSEGPEDAVSLDGKKLADQPFAFAYRASYNPICAAELHAGLSRVKEVATAYLAERNRPSTQDARTFLAVPLRRPEAGQDPETLANRSGDFEPAPISTQVAKAGSIRTVGPAYYYQTTVSVEGLHRKPESSHRFTLSMAAPTQADD